jgi:hypothetical protein
VLDVPDPNGMLFEKVVGRWGRGEAHDPLTFEVPTGRYRARVSSRGYTEASEGAEDLLISPFVRVIKRYLTSLRSPFRRKERTSTSRILRSAARR